VNPAHFDPTPGALTNPTNFNGLMNPSCFDYMPGTSLEPQKIHGGAGELAALGSALRSQDGRPTVTPWLADDVQKLLVPDKVVSFGFDYLSVTFNLESNRLSDLEKIFTDLMQAAGYNEEISFELTCGNPNYRYSSKSILETRLFACGLGGAVGTAQIVWSGKSLDALTVRQRLTLILLCHEHENYKRCSRIDIKIDVKTDKFTPEQMFHYMEMGDISSRTKTVTKKNLFGREVVVHPYKFIPSIKGSGSTFYLGHRTSQRYLRVYNASAMGHYEEDGVTRFELEIKGKMSTTALMLVAESIAETSDIETLDYSSELYELVSTLFNSFCRVHCGENTRLENRPIMPEWMSLFGYTRVSLSPQKSLQPMANTFKFIDRIKRALARAELACPGFVDTVTRLGLRYLSPLERTECVQEVTRTHSPTPPCSEPTLQHIRDASSALLHASARVSGLTVAYQMACDVLPVVQSAVKGYQPGLWFSAVSQDLRDRISRATVYRDSVLYP